jgi:hypothetical protein
VSTFDQVAQLVEDDVVEGLGDAFTSTTGFSVLEHFSGKAFPVGEVTFVPWQYGCRHVGKFYGLCASLRDVLIVGVTAVESPDSDSPTFARFIDWANVFAQLGATIAARPITAPH